MCCRRLAGSSNFSRQMDLPARRRQHIGRPAKCANERERIYTTFLSPRGTSGERVRERLHGRNAFAICPLEPERQRVSPSPPRSGGEGRERRSDFPNNPSLHLSPHSFLAGREGRRAPRSSTSGSWVGEIPTKTRRLSPAVSSSLRQEATDKCPENRGGPK